MAIRWISTILLFFLVSSLASSREVQTSEIRSGDSLPAFSLLTDAGDSISTETLRGRPSFIVFFHTKCFDCQKELPMVQELYEKYIGKVQFIAISRAQPREEVQRYWRDNCFRIPVASQNDKHVFRLFAKKTIPRIYITDSEGIVCYTFKERVKKKRLVRAFEKLLSEEK